MAKIRKHKAGDAAHTHDTIKETFSCAESGQVIWVKPTGARSRGVGNRAGYDTDQGYRYVECESKQMREHILIFNWVTGHYPLCVVDHINHNRADNSWNNLRDVSRSDNMNSRLFYSKELKRWIMQMAVNGKKVVRAFTTKVEAQAHDWHGDFSPGEFVTLADIANALKVVNYKIAA